MSSTSNMARDGAARDTGNAASTAASEISADLAALRDDVARLAQQVASILSARGGATWRRTRSNVEGMISEAQDTGAEVMDAARKVGDEVADSIGQSVRKRPYTILAVAIGIGFLFGATWRR
jgi:ElaB/YqjD/DUF883 family membrane-anchored ribosome-binding protein